MPQNWRFSVTQADGRVLVISPPGAARYDPSTGRFTEISSRLPESAEFGSATVLMDGRILVIGQDLDGRQTSTLFDPETGRAVDAGPTVVSRLEHVAVRLQDGRVLLAGGDPAQVGQLRPVQGAGGATASAELYDPVTGTFTPTGDMARRRGLGATATLLADGRVLVAGGAGGGPDDLAELFDPTTGQFTPTGAMSEPRTDFTATLLDDGRVLFAGGYSTAGAPGIRRLATDGDIYDPATGTFSPTQPMVVPRFGHVAALLRDGRVLIAGGNDTVELQTQTGAAEIFDPSTGLFEPTSLTGDPARLCRCGGPPQRRRAGIRRRHPPGPGRPAKRSRFGHCGDLPMTSASRAAGPANEWPAGSPASNARARAVVSKTNPPPP